MTQCILNTVRNYWILLILILLQPAVLHPAARVDSGLDRLDSTSCEILKDKRVALVTNKTAVTKTGTGIIQVLQKHNIKIQKIFSPEHGFSAALDTKVSDSTVDGIPCFSLYGKNRKMNPTDLSDVDICLFDIQSVGARYYTYIATMVYTMQATAQSNTQMVILDRPNPSGGTIVSGFIPDRELTGKFTSIYPIPTRHGMTPGELARMFNAEYALECDLQVIKMRGWKRAMLYSDTGLPWIHPSPNIQREEAAILYTGLGWLETTALSMARGTPHAFEHLGAPYIDGEKLATSLSHIKGFTIQPVCFTPQAQYHKYYGRECNGISITMENKHRSDAFLLSLEIYRTLVSLCPKEYTDYGGLPVSSGRKHMRTHIDKQSSQLLVHDAAQQIRVFRKIRKRYLLY